MRDLTIDNLMEVTMGCLYPKGEADLEAAIQVQGVVLSFGVDPIRLEKHKQDIIDMLSQLPETFHEKTGGGWSFLQACMDNKGNQWASHHKDMDNLVCLGLAIEKVSFNMPRDMWSAFPGGMPYFVVKE